MTGNASPMDRAEWLKKLRQQAEVLYDHLAPIYWVKFGLSPDPVHTRFIKKLLNRMSGKGTILDAGCGAGRFDGMLAAAGHTVLGIDQSAKILARAREHYPLESHPGLNYRKMGLQEMDFHEEFDVLVCIDALEHVCPEDRPGIMKNFSAALKPGGLLYMTIDTIDKEEIQQAYERAKAQGLPVVYGEVVDRVEGNLSQVLGLDPHVLPAGLADPAVYHYYPSRQQTRAWLDHEGFIIEESGRGDGYAHFLCRKK